MKLITECSVKIFGHYDSIWENHLSFVFHNGEVDVATAGKAALKC